ncbi:MAG TPA: pitrilysin family protein [Candidatus Limnocylindria bacterium]|nr:pitrilysin family protein [Candidatus Limnocylindria bacterium]
MTEQAPLTQHRLANGLRVLLAQDRTVPVVSAALTYRVGSANEAPGRSGFAHLFEHMMFQGSANVGRTAHLRDIQAIGGRVSAFTTWDTTKYLNTVPSHQLPVVLWMEADRMATLADSISQESLDNQREVVKNERRSEVDNMPYGGAEEQLFAMALGDDHPYGHSYWGLMSDLEAATVDDVRAFFRTYYVPNNVELVLAGDFEADAALALVEQYFGFIPAGPAPRAPDGSLPLQVDQPMHVIRAHDVPAPRLFMACRIAPFGSDAWDVADMAVSVLNWGRAARLQTRLVRELRIADEVEAAAYELANGVSLVEIDVAPVDGVEPATIDAALSEELDRLAADPPSEEELRRVRVGRATSYAVGNQDRESRADRIGFYAAMLDEPERYGQEEARDLAVTSEAIAAFARDRLSAPNRVSLWLLPSEG